jgi:hypothetical protein
MVYALKDVPHSADVYLYRTYNSHGSSGGSCWGDEARAYSNDPPQSFNFDDFSLKLCEEFCPEISFIKYKRLMMECIVHDEYHEREYYGNYSVHKLIAFDLRKFAEGVQEYVVNNQSSFSSSSNFGD